MATYAQRLADAAAAEITTASKLSTWGGEQLLAESPRLHRFQLEDADLRCTVIPQTTSITSAARGQAEREYQLLVTISKQTETVEPVEIDPLLDTVEAVSEYFAANDSGDMLCRPVDGVSNAYYTAVVVDPLYDPSILDEQSLFVSLLTLTVTVYP